MSPEWQDILIGDVLLRSTESIVLSPELQYKEITVKSWGKGVVLRGIIKGSEIAANSRFLARKGQLIISKIGARQGAIGIVPDELDQAVVSGDFPLFFIDKSKIEPGFLKWLIKTSKFIDLCRTISEGTTRVRLKVERFLQLSFPLPPLDEQRKIVDHIERLTAKIDEALVKFEIFCKETDLIIESELSRLHQLYGSIELGRICERITDGEHKTPPRTMIGVPLLNAKNVREGYLDLKMTDFVDASTADVCRKRCNPSHNDILIVCVGATTGRVCRLINPPTMVLTRDVALVRPNQRLLDSNYLEFILKSREVQDQIWLVVNQSAIPHLYLKKIASLKIPLPTLQVQQEIVVRLKKIHENANKAKLIQKESYAELRALMPSILDKSFTAN